MFYTLEVFFGSHLPAQLRSQNSFHLPAQPRLPSQQAPCFQAFWLSAITLAWKAHSFPFSGDNSVHLRRPGSLMRSS